MLDTVNERFTLESQIRECYGRAVYSHKTHEKMAEKSSQTLSFIKIGQIIISALTAAGAVTLLFDKTPWLPYVTAILSILTVILNSYVKDIDPGGLAQKHRDAAVELWNIREAYLSLLTDAKDPLVAMEDCRKKRNELQALMFKVYQSAPQTDSKGYERAQKALKSDNELTFSEEELDHLLPPTLRRGKGPGTGSENEAKQSGNPQASSAP